jgi:transcriptional regulator with XRE-family HTH domain
VSADPLRPRIGRAPSPGPRAPQPAATIRIGPRLRGARRRAGLSIGQLAEATGLTKGFISQVERDLTTASVASLVSICDALGIGVGSLFEPSRTDLVRRGDRPRINFGGEGVTEWLLTPSSQERLQVIQGEIEPGGGSGGEPYSLPADSEFVHVVSGELELVIEDDTYRLAAGDSLTFAGRDPHTWSNPSDTEPAVVLWVLTPPVH